MLVLDDLIHIYAVLGIFLIICLFIFTCFYISMKLDKYLNENNKKEREKIKKIVKEVENEKE